MRVRISPSLPFINTLMDSVEHIIKGSDTLVIAFSGFYKTIRNTSFEWGILRKYDIDVLYVMDDKQRWYLKGIKDVSTDVQSTTKYLDLVGRDYRRVIFLGSSMGGYGCLLYGSLSTHKNKWIHAFSPQIEMISYNYPPLINDPEVVDFDQYHDLSTSVNIPDTTTIYYGSKNSRDHKQISLVDCKKVLYDTDQHRLAAYLRDRGELPEMVESIIK